MIQLDANGNLTTNGKKVPRKDPLSYFTKDAPIMHGRFGTHDATHHSDHVAAAEVQGSEDDVDPALKAKIARLFDFDHD